MASLFVGNAVLLHLLALVAIALLFEHLESLYFFRRDLVPGNGEVGAIELQFKHPLEQAPRGWSARARTPVRSWGIDRTCLRGTVAAPALRALPGRGGVVYLAPGSARLARYVVGVRGSRVGPLSPPSHNSCDAY